VTIWEMLAEAVHELPEPFTRRDVLEWFERNRPTVNPSSVSTHLQFATSNRGGTTPGMFDGREPLVTRIEHGRYIRFTGAAEPAGRHRAEIPAPAPPPVAPKVPAPVSRPDARGSDIGPFDVHRVLDALALARPVFHSEADFQFAFAWVAKEMTPSLQIALECRPEPRVRLDLLLRDSKTGWRTAIEFKYLTAGWSGDWDGVPYRLPQQGAQDLGGYGVVKDVGRIERFIGLGFADDGYAIALTNDPSYLRMPNHGRETNADAFRLHEGVTLSGIRDWRMPEGGTAKGNPAIDLRGTYDLTWRTYSSLPGPRGTFSALVVHVPRSDPAPTP
jgi:hypothetical protein